MTPEGWPAALATQRHREALLVEGDPAPRGRCQPFEGVLV